MPISINGSGTVTGISVGGLPDGIVDTDMLAAKAATAPKLGNGTIIQHKYVEMTDSSFTMNSTTATDVPQLTNTISLTSASNNTRITVSVTPYMGGTGNGRYSLTILRDSTEIYDENHVIYRSGAFKAQRNHHTILDTGVSDTSSHTYKVQVERLEGSDGFYLFGNSGKSKQVLILEEITA